MLWPRCRIELNGPTTAYRASHWVRSVRAITAHPRRRSSTGIYFPRSEVCPVVQVVSSRPNETCDAPFSGTFSRYPLVFEPRLADLHLRGSDMSTRAMTAASLAQFVVPSFWPSPDCLLGKRYLHQQYGNRRHYPRNRSQRRCLYGSVPGSVAAGRLHLGGDASLGGDRRAEQFRARAADAPELTARESGPPPAASPGPHDELGLRGSAIRR